MTDIRCSSCAVIDNKMWFVTRDNYFMFMDVETGEPGYALITGNNVFNSVCNNMVVVGREIFWAEQNGKRFLSFNVDTNICKEYMLEGLIEKESVTISLVSAWNNTVVIVPKYTNRLLLFDVEKKELEIINNVLCDELIKADCYVSCSYINGDNLYMFISDSETLIQYSLNKRKKYIIDRGDAGFSVCSVYLYKDDLFLLGINGELLILDNHFKMKKKYNIVAKGYEIIFVVYDKLILLPSTANDFLSLNIDDGKLELISCPEDFIFDDIQWGKHVCYYEQNDYIIVPNRMSNYVLIMKKNNAEWRWVKYKQVGRRNFIDYIRNNKGNVIGKDNLDAMIEYLKNE